jgi:hypothetical protein
MIASLAPVCTEPLPDNVVGSTCRTVPPGSTCRCVINPSTLGKSGFGIVPKGDFGPAEVTAGRGANIETDTVVVGAPVCCGQVQAVIRRHQAPKRVILVP